MNKRRLSSEIGRELEAAGFTRSSRHWELDTGRVLWLVLLDHHSDNDSVYLSIAAVPSGWDSDRGGYLLNEPLHQLLPGTSGTTALTTDAVPHPLVIDTRDVLIPLIARLDTPDAILDEWLRGNLGDPDLSLSARIATGYRRAGSVGSRRHQELAQEIALREGWTNEDRFYFAESGLAINGSTEVPAFLANLPWAFSVNGDSETEGNANQYSWDGRRWSEGPPKKKHWLTIELHDGDIAHVRFREDAASKWESAWLGALPEVLFDDPRLAEDHDFSRSARSLAARVSRASGVPIDSRPVERLLVAAAADDPLHDFVEETVEELLDALGLPRLP